MLKVAVVRFPGSNCDFDTLRAAERVGADAFFVWHRDTGLQGADIVLLPGGFSYGDYLRSGAIARFSPVMQAVQRHAAAGGPVLGICNGFQILCEAHLLPGALMRNAGLTFVSKPVDVVVERTDTVFTSAYEPNATVRLPVAHGDGRFVAAEDTLRMLEAEGRVVLRYVAGQRVLAAAAQPERLRASHRRHLQRGGDRGGHHAPSGAHRRPAARRARRSRVLHLSRGLAAAGHQPQGAKPMTTDKPSRNEDEYFVKQDAELINRRRAEAEAAAREAERKSHYMKCPKDGHDLASSVYHGVQIETCPHCEGMWLDAGELDAVAHEDRPGADDARALGCLQHPRAKGQEVVVTSSTASGLTEAVAFPGERAITPEVVREHNLNELEYDRILELLGRAPTLTELGVFSALWSEHCSYKHSKPVLKTFPTTGAAGRPGSRARTRACFGCRMDGRWRSRSSRTTIRPRSSRTRARRPGSAASCATCSPWAPGPWPCSTASASVRWISRATGTSSPASCAAWATTATAWACRRSAARSGSRPGYTGNPLVNAMCVGLLKESDLIRAAAHGVGNILLCVGARTGRDGIHGASFASEELSEKSEARRPQVQVGDPFTEKLLLEASLELITSGLIVAIQDMGAAGLTSSSAEMAARGGVGVEIDTSLVPTREPGMTPYEILLSESQERMLVVAEPDRVPEIQAVCAKWELSATPIGAGDRRRDLPRAPRWAGGRGDPRSAAGG